MDEENVVTFCSKQRLNANDVVKVVPSRQNEVSTFVQFLFFLLIAHNI